MLIQSDTATATDPRFRAVVARRAATPGRRCPTPRTFESPYAPGNAGRSRPTGIPPCIRFEIAGDDTQAQDRVGATLGRHGCGAGGQSRTSRSRSSATPASTSRSTTSISDDFKQALVTSLPITLLILLIAFGALVAAGVPLLLALTAVIATIGIIGPDQPHLARWTARSTR